ncbi:MAG: ssl1498 family light-harvesting-like protein [Aphanocapsa sp. GSE-SYN-MK-11-07L]|jgi:hypothetical protein|nr:ssl1498 family light-harvesting-like protein [Aphanocapsa sp. GSE-SYN-MK-11-07L]
MPYTIDEDGRINNFAIEPKMYQADPPTSGQKRIYLVAGFGALVLVGGLMAIAVAVS